MTSCRHTQLGGTITHMDARAGRAQSSDSMERLAQLAVGNHLRAERNRAGLTQTELAKATKMDVNTIGRLENAERDLKLSQLVKIAAVLGTTPGEFIDDAQAAMQKQNVK